VYGLELNKVSLQYLQIILKWKTRPRQYRDSVKDIV